jgi:Ca2+-binding EF-hand superfamily protein
MLLQSAPKPEDTVALKAIFDKHDGNKNGVIEKHELPAVLEDSLKRKLPASLMDKYVNTIFAKHDKDNSNTVRPSHATSAPAVLFLLLNWGFDHPAA